MFSPEQERVRRDPPDTASREGSPSPSSGVSPTSCPPNGGCTPPTAVCKLYCDFLFACPCPPPKPEFLGAETQALPRHQTHVPGTRAPPLVAAAGNVHREAGLNPKGARTARPSEQVACVTWRVRLGGRGHVGTVTVTGTLQPGSGSGRLGAAGSFRPKGPGSEGPGPGAGQALKGSGLRTDESEMRMPPWRALLRGQSRHL